MEERPFMAWWKTVLLWPRKIPVDDQPFSARALKYTASVRTRQVSGPDFSRAVRVNLDSLPRRQSPQPSGKGDRRRSPVKNASNQHFPCYSSLSEVIS